MNDPFLGRRIPFVVQSCGLCIFVLQFFFIKVRDTPSAVGGSCPPSPDARAMGRVLLEGTHRYRADTLYAARRCGGRR